MNTKNLLLKGLNFLAKLHMAGTNILYIALKQKN
jgi:hypothetical protein